MKNFLNTLISSQPVLDRNQSYQLATSLIIAMEHSEINNPLVKKQIFLDYIKEHPNFLQDNFNYGENFLIAMFNPGNRSPDGLNIVFDYLYENNKTLLIDMINENEFKLKQNILHIYAAKQIPDNADMFQKIIDLLDPKKLVSYLNQKDVEGNTPAHLAADVNHPKELKILLLLKSSLTTQNNFGWTVLEQAQKRNSLEAIAVIKHHMAEVEGLKLVKNFNQLEKSNKKKKLKIL